MVEESQGERDAREEREAKLREDREKAIEYGEKVLAGEEPWKDEEADVNDFKDDGEDVELLPEPRNDDVGEAGEPGDEVVEVDQENPVPTE